MSVMSVTSVTSVISVMSVMSAMSAMRIERFDDIKLTVEWSEAKLCCVFDFGVKNGFSLFQLNSIFIRFGSILGWKLMFYR